MVNNRDCLISQVNLILVLQVSGQQADLAIPPIIIKPTIITPPPLDVCIPILTTAVDEAAILDQLNSGELAPEAPSSSAAFSILPRKCEDGPLRVSILLYRQLTCFVSLD